MNKIIKWIIILSVVIGFGALLIWKDKIEPGSVIAGLTVIIAVIKSKLFGYETLKEKISEIESSHQLKRDEWEKEKLEYDNKLELMKIKMDSIDNKTETLKEKLEKTNQPDFIPKSQSNKDILDWMNDI